MVRMYKFMFTNYKTRKKKFLTLVVNNLLCNDNKAFSTLNSEQTLIRVLFEVGTRLVEGWYKFELSQ
jgi:hypothetical protein